MPLRQDECRRRGGEEERERVGAEGADGGLDARGSAGFAAAPARKHRSHFRIPGLARQIIQDDSMDLVIQIIQISRFGTLIFLLRRGWR